MMKIQDARFLKKESRESLRRRVVHAVVDKQLKQSEAARIFGVCAYSVSKWMRAFREHGEEALANKPTGRPATGGRLAHKHWLDFQRILMTKSPGDFAIASTLWDRKSIAFLLEKKFGVVLSKTGITELLAKMGFSAQRPSFIATQRNEKKVETWLKEEYPAIKKKPKKKTVKSFLAMKQK